MEEIANTVANQTQDTSKLSRSQRLAARNEIILAKLATGITIPQLQEEFQLSNRQIYNIINTAQEQMENWFDNFPKTGMLSIFRNNIFAVAEEIKTLTSLKSQAQTLQEKIEVSKQIIDARVKYNKIAAEGPTYIRLKEVVKNAQST